MLFFEQIYDALGAGKGGWPRLWKACLLSWLVTVSLFVPLKLAVHIWDQEQQERKRIQQIQRDMERAVENGEAGEAFRRLLGAEPVRKQPDR